MIVVATNLIATTVASKHLSQYLTKSEFEKYFNIKKFQKMDWLVGRIALKETAKQFLMKKLIQTKHNLLQVKNTDEGVPYISGFPKLKCSISHSYGHSVAGISENSTGV